MLNRGRVKNPQGFESLTIRFRYNRCMGERKGITVDYNHGPTGWDVRFAVDGEVFDIPLKALRAVVEEGDRREAKRLEELRLRRITDSIRVLGRKDGD